MYVIGSQNKLSSDVDKKTKTKQDDINKEKRNEEHTSKLITTFFTRKKVLTVTSVLLMLTTLAIVLVLTLNKPEGEFSHSFFLISDNDK